MAIPLIIAGGLMAAGAIGGGASRGRKNRKMRKMIKNMPKYKINEEAYDNQALARSRAFGRDRSIQMRQQQLDQDAANAMQSALDVSSNTSDLLSTVAAINANKNASKRDLAIDEVTLQNQRMNELYAANQAMIDEKDKEFAQNKMAPWDANMRLMQAKKEEANSAWGSVFQAGTSILGSYAGGGGGAGK